MKIIGLWSGHDASYCVLDEGVVAEHSELERHVRVKEPAGDSAQMFLDKNGDVTDVVGYATVFPHEKTTATPGWEKLFNTSAKNLEGHQPWVFGHHQAHAANAFYSSNFDDAVVLTIDGGGIENRDGLPIATSCWSGSGTQLTHHFNIHADELNVGGIWSRVTRYVFRYESGWPQGHQAGTVMALAALGKPDKWIDDFRAMFRDKRHLAGATPHGHIKGMSAKDPLSPKHPYLKKWEEIAAIDDQERYNMAAAFQQATEEIVKELVGRALDVRPGSKYLCLAGGVALNSVSTGKIREWYPELEGVFVPPVPYDGGLCIGAAQYLWHHVMNKPRVKWVDHATPYLGKLYARPDVDAALSTLADRIIVKSVEASEVIDRLTEGCIVSVFNGRAESGRRALGNRSILADPRRFDMKDRVNEKVKHRQWFRPFAPSVLREYVSEWFKTDVDSPYMSFVSHLKDETRGLVPAIVHFDGSARLQTVTANDNPWYHAFISAWHARTGVPIILNTSFNDREPICETPEHAVTCFMRTDIDYLYFPEWKLLVSKTESN